MARIPYPDLAALSPEARAALERVPPLNIFRMLATAQANLVPFLRFTGGLWSETELSPRRRELAILQTARSCNAEYEWHQHVAVARLCDITDEEIGAVDHGRLELFGPDDRALLEFAAAIATGPRADDATFAAVREHLSDREIVELHLVVGIYTALARLMTNLELEIDDQQGAALLQRDGRGPRLDTGG